MDGGIKWSSDVQTVLLSNWHILMRNKLRKKGEQSCGAKKVQKSESRLERRDTKALKCAVNM